MVCVHFFLTYTQNYIIIGMGHHLMINKVMFNENQLEKKQNKSQKNKTN